MMRDLDLQAVSVDGCATGITDKNSALLSKPWLIAVSSTALVEELNDFRCTKDHDHSKIAGDELENTAYYPRALCEAIYHGLGAHVRTKWGCDCCNCSHLPEGCVSFGIGPQGSVCTSCRTGCRVSSRVDCLFTRHRLE